MENKPKYIVFDHRQSLGSNVASTFLTISLLTFSIWLSKDDKFWTFITGILFILYLWGKLKSTIDERTNKFTSADDLIAWAEKQKERE